MILNSSRSTREVNLVQLPWAEGGHRGAKENRIPGEDKIPYETIQNLDTTWAFSLAVGPYILRGTATMTVINCLVAL